MYLIYHALMELMGPTKSNLHFSNGVKSMMGVSSYWSHLSLKSFRSRLMYGHQYHVRAIMYGYLFSIRYPMISSTLEGSYLEMWNTGVSSGNSFGKGDRMSETAFGPLWRDRKSALKLGLSKFDHNLVIELMEQKNLSCNPSGKIWLIYQVLQRNRDQYETRSGNQEDNAETFYKRTSLPVCLSRWWCTSAMLDSSAGWHNNWIFFSYTVVVFYCFAAPFFVCLSSQLLRHWFLLHFCYLFRSTNKNSTDESFVFVSLVFSLNIFQSMYMCVSKRSFYLAMKFL